MRRSHIALLSGFLTLHVSGCSTWVHESGSPRDYIEARGPSQLRLTLRDSQTVVLRDTRVAGNTLEGRVPGGGSQVVPLAEVDGFEVLHLRAAATLAVLVALGTVVTGLVFYVGVLQSS